MCSAYTQQQNVEIIIFIWNSDSSPICHSEILKANDHNMCATNVLTVTHYTELRRTETKRHREREMCSSAYNKTQQQK